MFDTHAVRPNYLLRVPHFSLGISKAEAGSTTESIDAVWSPEPASSVGRERADWVLTKLANWVPSKLKASHSDSGANRLTRHGVNMARIVRMDLDSIGTPAAS